MVSITSPINYSLLRVILLHYVPHLIGQRRLYAHFIIAQYLMELLPQVKQVQFEKNEN